MTKNRLGTSIVACAAAILLLVWAGTASAQLRMSGGWLQQRGTVNIPAWVVPLGPLNGSILGLDPPTIPGDGFVTVIPGNPPAFNIPAGLFKLPTRPNQIDPSSTYPANAQNNGRKIPLQAALSGAFGTGNGGDVIQLTTTFTFAGPGMPGALAATGTSLRLSPNFSFCPGAINNPSCANNIAGGNDGTQPGRVRYTAGPDQYGGTMGMLITGGGEVANSLGGSPLRIRHDGIAGAGSQEVGLAYGNTSSVILVGGEVTTGATFTPNGLIGMAGNVTSIAAADTNVNTGFPWTTGQVIVSEPGGATAMDTAETYTMTGSKNLTSNGRGTLSLVAGGMSHRLVSGQTFVSVDKITMSIAGGQLTPALSPTGVVAIASLLVIGGGYVLRKRL